MSTPTELTVRPLPPLPAIQPGDDLAAIITGVHGKPFDPADVLVISHKVVSKAEGAIVELASVKASTQAVDLAGKLDKDPALVQVVLDQTEEIIRAQNGVLICRTIHGLVAANAGVDRSNVDPGFCVTLPADPDASARELRSKLSANPGVIIADSFSRPWRVGQVEVAIGCAGIHSIDDMRGRNDHFGREMNVSQIAVADQLAGAADLVRSKSSGQPVVLISGAGHYRRYDDGPGAASLQRDPAGDLFGPPANG